MADIFKQIEADVKQNKIMIFMKGTRSFPQCGFSAATVRIFYGLTRSARFRDQLVASALSQGGDSGSLVVDTENHAVGLLFAGSSNTTILNPIGQVESLLGIEL